MVPTGDPRRLTKVESVLSQSLRRAPVFRMVVGMVVITIGLLAYDRPSASTVAFTLAALVALLFAGVWAVRHTWVRLVENRIEIREWPHGTTIATRSAVKVIDAHSDRRVGLYSNLDKLGELPTGWGRADAQRLAHELGTRVCTGPGPDCPRTR